jgi:hypothetical protein
MRLSPSVRIGLISVVILVCVWGPASAGEAFDLRVISSRPDTVSGDDALVQLTAPKDSKWVALLNGQDVSRAFRPTEGSGNLRALLTGLKQGDNTLEIRVDGATKARLAIVDHPLAGPVFSGPHQQPFICQTEASGLGPALDKDCSAKTIVQYYYKSKEDVRADLSASPPPTGTPWPGFKTYNADAPPPSDVAQTVTTDGRSVPYIVRREIGTINRAVYDIQFLHQPGQPLPTPWSQATPGWNGRLVYLFGGGWSVGYHQGVLDANIGEMQEPFLAQGYALATATLNTFGNTSNDRISAETLSMVKEHFIKEYGEPVHLIGFGGSGGAMEQHLIAQNYPGLVNGIIVEVSFPDMVTTTQGTLDCHLLAHVLRTSKGNWTDEQKAAVSGLASLLTCQGWGADVDGRLRPLSVFDAHGFCDSSLPKDILYDPATNAGGTRCDIYSGEVNLLGRDSKTGFVRSPIGNVGVQYGLVAFEQGKISAEQFVELNERIGGFDRDGHFVETRTEADTEAVKIAYQSGFVLTGGGGLSEIPIIDHQPYADDMANQHDHLRAFVTRARLMATNGTAANQVIVVYPRYTIMDTLLFMKNFSTWPDRTSSLVRQMDHWLDNVAADHSGGTQAEKVARDKPSDVADGCWTVGGEHFVEPAVYGGKGSCNQLYPPHADPRIAAGGPLTDDVLKCALKPIDSVSYRGKLSADQLRRLQAVFPTGVCDYNRPGIGQQITRATWLTY